MRRHDGTCLQMKTKSTPSINYRSLHRMFQVCCFRSSMSLHPWRNLLFPIVEAQKKTGRKGIFRSHMERTRSFSAKKNSKILSKQKKATKMEMEVEGRGKNLQPMIRKPPGEKAFVATIGSWKSSWNWSFFSSKPSSLGADRAGGCLHNIFDVHWKFYLCLRKDWEKVSSNRRYDDLDEVRCRGANKALFRLSIRSTASHGELWH